MLLRAGSVAQQLCMLLVLFTKQPALNAGVACLAAESTAARSST